LGVEFADDDDVAVVVVGQVLSLLQLVGVFHLLERFLLIVVLLQVLGQLLVASSVEVLAAA